MEVRIHERTARREKKVLDDYRDEREKERARSANPEITGIGLVVHELTPKKQKAMDAHIWRSCS